MSENILQETIISLDLNSRNFGDEATAVWAPLRRAIAAARRLPATLEAPSAGEKEATWKFVLWLLTEFPLTARQVMEAAETLFSSESWSAVFSDLEISWRRKFALWRLKGSRKPAEIFALAVSKVGISGFFESSSDFQVLQKFPDFFRAVAELLPENLAGDLLFQIGDSLEISSPEVKISRSKISSPEIPRFEKQAVLELLEDCEYSFLAADPDLRNFQVCGSETVPKCLARACANLRREISDSHCRAVLLGGCQSGKTLLSLFLCGFPAPPAPGPSCVFTKFQHTPGQKIPQLTVPLDLVFLLSRLDPAAMAGEDLTTVVEGGEEISRLVGKINSILFQAKPKLLSGDFLEISINLEFPEKFPGKFTLIDTPSPDAQIFRGPAQVAAQVRRSLRNANFVFVVLDATAPEAPRGLFDLVEEAIQEESFTISDVTVFLNKSDSLPFGPSQVRFDRFSEIFKISALRSFLTSLGRISEPPVLPGNFLSEKSKQFFPRLLAKSVAQAKFFVANFLEEIAILKSPSFAFSESAEIEAIFSQYADDLRQNLEISSLRELPAPGDSSAMIRPGSGKFFEATDSQPVLEFFRNFADSAVVEWQASFLAAAAAAAEDAANLRPKWLRSSALFLRRCGAPAGARKQAVSLFQNFEEPLIPGNLILPAVKINDLIFGRAKLIRVETRRTLFAAEGLKRFEISENCLAGFLVSLCELFRAEALKKLEDFFLKPAVAEFQKFREILETQIFAGADFDVQTDFCERVSRF